MRSGGVVSGGRGQGCAGVLRAEHDPRRSRVDLRQDAPRRGTRSKSATLYFRGSKMRRKTGDVLFVLAVLLTILVCGWWVARLIF